MHDQMPPQKQETFPAAASSNALSVQIASTLEKRKNAWGATRQIDRSLEALANRLVQSEKYSANDKLRMLLEIHESTKQNAQPFLSEALSSAIAGQAQFIVDAQKNEALALYAPISNFLKTQSILAHLKFDRFGNPSTLYDRMQTLEGDLSAKNIAEQSAYLSGITSELQSAKFLFGFSAAQTYAEKGGSYSDVQLSSESQKIRLAASSLFLSALLAGKSASNSGNPTISELGKSLSLQAEEKLRTMEGKPPRAIVEAISELFKNWEEISGEIAKIGKRNEDETAISESFGIPKWAAYPLMELKETATIGQFGCALILSGICWPAGAAAFSFMGVDGAIKAARAGDIAGFVTSLAMMVPGISAAAKIASMGERAGASVAGRMLNIGEKALPWASAASTSWITADMALSIAREVESMRRTGVASSQPKAIAENLLQLAIPHVLRARAAGMPRLSETRAAEKIKSAVSAAKGWKDAAVKWKAEKIDAELQGVHPVSLFPPFLDWQRGIIYRSPDYATNGAPHQEKLPHNLDKTVQECLAAKNPAPYQQYLINHYIETAMYSPHEGLSKSRKKTLMMALDWKVKSGDFSVPEFQYLQELKGKKQPSHKGGMDYKSLEKRALTSLSADELRYVFKVAGETVHGTDAAVIEKARQILSAANSSGSNPWGITVKEYVGSRRFMRAISDFSFNEPLARQGAAESLLLSDGHSLGKMLAELVTSKETSQYAAALAKELGISGVNDMGNAKKLSSWLLKGEVFRAKEPGAGDFGPKKFVAARIIPGTGRYLVAWFSENPLNSADCMLEKMEITPWYSGSRR